MPPQELGAKALVELPKPLQQDAMIQLANPRQFLELIQQKIRR
jgi:hypothetical protein